MICIVMKQHDIQGKVFGKWTVLHKSLIKRAGDNEWVCKCECGRLSQVKATYLVNGKSKRCNYCHKHSKRYYETNNVPQQLWEQIIRNAEKRNIQLNVSREEAFLQFQKQAGKCALSNRVISFPTCATEWRQANASLDRIDNSNGYTVDNIQWLHKDVNKMKNTYDEAYFVSLCVDIASNH